MKKKFIFLLMLLASIILLINIVLKDDVILISPNKNSRADLQNKVITNKSELEEIAKKEHLNKVPKRIETEYIGPQ
ncbi:hypothetical protein BVG16_15600 [Paenibacillus selenitireducens]|uniref:Uncharacterized protein n=1 Tax=Paenibacillus selenitireducens TaxID=1324314 RepID=A0A1T2X9M6_9BACL|nr:hypothetical protein BVG16_15600 [Paenibacillus selenitireducens]